MARDPAFCVEEPVTDVTGLSSVALRLESSSTSNELSSQSSDARLAEGMRLDGVGDVSVIIDDSGPEPMSRLAFN